MSGGPPSLLLLKVAKIIWPIVSWDFCDPVNLLKISSPCKISARCPLSKRCSLVRVNLNIADIAKVWVTLSVSSLVMRGWLCVVVDHNLAIWSALPGVSQWEPGGKKVSCKYLWRTISGAAFCGKSWERSGVAFCHCGCCPQSFNGGIFIVTFFPFIFSGGKKRKLCPVTCV